MIDVGTVINSKYRLTRLLGDGGMGSVYEAVHAVLGTRVAIKVLHPELARRTGLVERFLQEARVAAQIRSAHVVQVTDVDRTADGHAYIVMELLEGEPLSSVLDRQRKLPVGVACDYTVQVLEALEAAHALGVIHRDLKPENVFVTFVGGKAVLKLIDFGIAKARRTDPQGKNLTVAGVVMGTAEYMAPEQARSADQVDARADIYAVGVMLYEMIAGARPVNGDDARIIALKVERGEVVPLVQVARDVPREIAGFVHRAMAPRPEMRFATATETRLALQAATAGKRLPTAGMAVAPAAHMAGATLELAAPAPPRPQAPGATSAEAAPVDTVRAPPMATALAQPVFGMGVAMGVPGHPMPERGRRRGPLIVLVALPLLLGAGVVIALVVSGTWASGTTDPQPTPSSPPPPENTTSATPQPTSTTTATSTAVPTLVPTRPTPVAPRPAPSNHPPGPPPSADGGAIPPFIFPSSLPTVFPPFPSGFPLPAGFPTSLPSALPSIFPPWPPPFQTPPPTPSAHAASSGGD